MHRIEGANQSPAGHFSDGDPLVPRPPTSLTALWCDTVQEELAKVVETAGLTLETSGTETKDQLLAALRLLALTAQNASPFKGSSNAGKIRAYFFPGGIAGPNGTELRITINAAWNSGSSQWDLDSAASPALMFRLAAGSAGGISPSSADVGVFRNDSGASFADAAWVRGVNGRHGFAYGANYADAGGGTTTGGYRLGFDNRLELGGACLNNGVAGTVATLPAGTRPTTAREFVAAYYDGVTYNNFCVVQVATNGDITTTMPAGVGHILRLDGIAFNLSD